ncbi:MAG: hypothetical protein ABR886_08250 [Dehalococcoidales bacterium]
MTIEENSQGRNNSLDENKKYQRCHDCGKLHEVDRLLVAELEYVCIDCRQIRVNETLQYIKELLNDSNLRPKN